MKKVLYLSAIVLSLASCGNDSTNETSPAVPSGGQGNSEAIVDSLGGSSVTPGTMPADTSVTGQSAPAK